MTLQNLINAIDAAEVDAKTFNRAIREIQSGASAKRPRIRARIERALTANGFTVAAVASTPDVKT